MDRVTDLNQGPQSLLALRGSQDMLRAFALVREGRLFDLERVRYPHMPAQGPAHVPLQVTAYRTPRGIQVQDDQKWVGENKVNFNWMSEVINSSAHCGAHIDSLAHATAGPDNHWFGGSTADKDLGDFGPLTHDASQIPPVITKGILIDIPALKGVDALPAHAAITADDVKAALTRQNTALQPGDIALIRTGQLDGWPNEKFIAEHELSGIDHGAAVYLADQGVVAIGSDGPCVENLPSSTDGNPHPVHIELLIERGIFILEMVDTTKLARKGIYEFCFIALPLKIKGATASMIRPVAIV